MTKLTFLGSGTSQGVPVIACNCWVCTSPDERDRRLRASVIVHHNGLNILIDTGPDFRTQMLREKIQHIDAVLYTHEHKDHTAGLDDVRAFNHICGCPIPVYAEERVLGALRKDFDYAFAEKKYPGVMDVTLHPITEQPFSVQPLKYRVEVGEQLSDKKAVEVLPIRGTHLNLPILGYRIGPVAYLTDFNRIEASEIEKLKGVEVLVINALRHEHHLSHFTLDEALHVRYLVGAPLTYFTHVSHQMGRYAQVEKTLPEGCHFAYDGLIVETN